MKAVLIILSIAMMSQVSLAGVLGRFRREAVAEGFSSAVDLVKHLAEATGPMVTSVLSEVPKTQPYDKYRHAMKEYLSAYDEYKTKEGLCIEKSAELLDKFTKLVERFEKADATVEAKKIDEIFNRYDSEDLEKEIEEFEKKLEAAQKESKEVDEEVEGFAILTKMLEVC